MVVAVVVSGVTKGIMCNTPQDSRRHVNVHVHADSHYLRKVIQFRNNNCSISCAARMKVTNQLYLHIRAHKTTTKILLQYEIVIMNDVVT